MRLDHSTAKKRGAAATARHSGPAWRCGAGVGSRQWGMKPRFDSCRRTERRRVLQYQISRKRQSKVCYQNERNASSNVSYLPVLFFLGLVICSCLLRSLALCTSLSVCSLFLLAGCVEIVVQEVCHRRFRGEVRRCSGCIGPNGNCDAGGSDARFALLDCRGIRRKD